MISDNRIEELEDCFYEETEESHTRVWRKKLTKEEKMLVTSWDRMVEENREKLQRKMAELEGNRKKY